MRSREERARERRGPGRVGEKNLRKTKRKPNAPNSRSRASISWSFTYVCPSYHPVSSYSTVALRRRSRT